MTTAIPLALTVLLILASVLLATLVSSTRAVAPSSSVDSGLRTTARRLLWARLAGLSLGLTASWLVLNWDGLGRGPLLATPALGLGILFGTLTGEAAAPRPHGAIRGASLEIRTARDYLPRFSAPLAGALSLVTVVLLAVTTATASADDMGRPGRVLAANRPDGTVRSAVSPWPGWFYAWPLLSVLAVAFLLSALAVHRVVRRGRLDLDAAARAVDDARRAHSARVVTAAYGICVALPLAGIAVVAGDALHRQSEFIGWATAGTCALLGVAVLSACSAVWYLAELLSRPGIKPS
ncbi:hypothetical protein Psi02_15880 [Planotetraspora silvatica]|uniref:Uncharacterized protein n=1 Tax=Planotetraspora silvatica TaxID=234614 RepID=A0A8J3UMV3_9ACTN|nr:hypothetical protein [Planotetraspora silvatica]GII45164.1 hypothetical protein Psi02_15880 [Planotetraspora silvatica]